MLVPILLDLRLSARSDSKCLLVPFIMGSRNYDEIESESRKYDYLVSFWQVELENCRKRVKDLENENAQLKEALSHTININIPKDPRPKPQLPPPPPPAPPSKSAVVGQSSPVTPKIAVVEQQQSPTDVPIPMSTEVSEDEADKAAVSEVAEDKSDDADKSGSNSGGQPPSSPTEIPAPTDVEIQNWRCPECRRVTFCNFCVRRHQGLR